MKRLMVITFAFLTSSVLQAKESKRKNSSFKQVSFNEEDSSNPEDSRQYPTTKRTKTGKKVIIKPDDEVSSDSSEYHRDNKFASLTLELIGLAPTPVSGLSAGYYMSPNHILEVRHTSGSYPMLFATIHNKMTSLHLKTFWGNSFYTNLGIANRQLGYSFDFPTIEEDGSISGFKEVYSIENSVLGIDLTLGNRWQWENFTLGCDWIGLFLPVSTSGKTAIVNSGNYAEEDLRDANNILTETSKQSSAQFLRFYLGLSF